MASAVPDQTIQSVVIAEQMLMNGVSTARELAGDVFGLKRAIDEGLVLGPRLYPSGAMISQTSVTPISINSRAQ